MAGRGGVTDGRRHGIVRSGAPGRARTRGRGINQLAAEWSGEETSIAAIERELARLREASTLSGVGVNQRTSVMTHCAWVPPRWLDAAEATLEGMAELHPSRTLILVPLPEEPDG